jgi:hypothetical protein
LGEGGGAAAAAAVMVVNRLTRVGCVVLVRADT